MEVNEWTQKQDLEAFLTRDRIGNAYLLGDLDPLYWPYCTWYTGHVEGTLRALVLLYTGLRLPVVLVASPGLREDGTIPLEGVEEILAHLSPILPTRFWIHIWEAGRSVLDQYYQAPKLQDMLRMKLRRDEYIPIPTQHPVRQLSHKDTASIVDLYQHFPDNFFEPYQLESGLYFGIDRPDQAGLCAIAGIHVYSQTYDIAAIGNLVVHPEERRNGYATAVTTHLLNRVFQDTSLVTLNVRKGNTAAIGTYRKFGFQKHGVFLEGIVESKRTGFVHNRHSS